MSRLDSKVEGIIIAYDTQGRNKVRFCESVTHRKNLLTKQGFTIVDTYRHPELVTRLEVLRHAYEQRDTFSQDTSRVLVRDALDKYEQRDLPRDLPRDLVLVEGKFVERNLLDEIKSRDKIVV